MDVQLPRLADTLVEGTVSRWLKQPGEQVRKGEPLVEIETDKVNSEIESPFEGVLTEILVPEGEMVPVGQVIARIGQPAPGEPSAAAGPGSRDARVAELVRRSAAAIPQGVCVREVRGPLDPAALEKAARTMAGDLALAVLAAPRAELAMPALQPGQDALLAPGAERDGSAYLTLCYDRRRLDDHAADRLLARIAAELGA